MRRTAVAATVAALVLAGCDGTSDPDQDPGPGASPTVPSTTEEEPTEDETTTEETTGAGGTSEEETTGAGGTSEEETTGAEGTSDTGNDAPADEDPDAPGLAEGPDWVDPGDEVRVPPAGDAIEASQEITGVRIAAHDDFDRVVLDLTGDEVVLGWFGLYEDAAYEAGSGRPIDIAGNAVLSVPVDGIDWVNPDPDRTDGSDLDGPGGTENVVEVVFGILFEGQQQVFVSVVDRTPYRIFPLGDPARIVIDVQHS